MPEIIDRRISFNGGELSPWLDPRIDLDKYRSGCRQLENMLPAIYGGAMRRPGTEYLGAAPTSSGKVRLVPFVASASTTYILEFSALMLRIWTTGTTPALVRALDTGVKEVTTITVNSASAALAEKTFILRDKNNNTVGFWMDYGITTEPAEATACSSQVEFTVTITNTTTVADDVAAAINDHADFVASNVGNVVTVTSARSGIRTDASASTSGFTMAVTVQGAEPAEAGVLEIVTTYLEADLDQLQFSQQNDVLFIAHPDHPPKELARYSANDWRLGALQIFWPATLAENASETTLDVAPITTTGEGAATAWSDATSYATLGGKVSHASKTWALKAACLDVEPGSGPLSERHWMETHGAGPTTDQCYGTGQKVTLTASVATFASTDVGSKWVVIHKRDDLKSEKAGSTSAGTYSTAIQVIGEWSAAVISAAGGTAGWETVFLVQRSLDNINWETRNVIVSGYGDVQKLITGFEKDPCFLRLKYDSKTATPPTGLKCYIEVGDPNSYSIYEITGYTSSTVVTALVYFPPWLDYTATKHWQEPAWSTANGFPRAVTLHQGRLFFGGNSAKPTTFWGSEVDGYTNFRVAAEDAAAVEYTLNSDEASAVEWLVSQDSLVIGTASGEWVFGTKSGETTEKLRRNTSYGSLPVQARTIADALVFIQRSGRKMREFAWSFERDGYNSVDLSMLAEHVGDDLFLQMAIQRNPDPIVWVVTAAGELLALTYERSQKVAAWSRHTTDGDFESVAVIPGSGEDDQIWVAVERTINAVTSRYIERLKPDVVRDLKSGVTTTLVYSDCSKTSTSSAGGLVSGLTHLIGESVSLLVDGAVHDPVTVSGAGTVQLAAVAANYSKTVVAGLPYTSTIEPTYLETMDPNSVTLAGKKRLHRAVLEFWKSGAIEVSTDDGVTFKPITFATGVTLMTGPHEMYLEGSSARQVTAIFRQSDPLPFNLMGVILRYNVEMG